MAEATVQQSSAQTAIAKKIASIIDSSIDTDQVSYLHITFSFLISLAIISIESVCYL